MILSNNGNLPKPYVDFVEKTCNQKHNEKGCYSATTLIQGVKCTILKDRHFDEITADVADFHNAVMGTAFHYIMESNTDNEKFLKEERLEALVSKSKVTGRFDLYDLENGIIYDWKTTNVFKHKFSDFSEWEKQALIYAWLFKKNGLEAKKVVFIAEFKDYSLSQAEKDSEYPRNPIQKEFEVIITEQKLSEIEKWISERVQKLEEAENLADDDIERCSNEEVWARGEKWAVMRNGRKTALTGGVCDTEAEANAKLTELKGDYVEHRLPEYVKCKSYCTACKFCSFYKEQYQNK